MKLTLKQLKELAPSEVSLSAHSSDDVLVELPLNVVLSRVRPEHLARRAGQRRVFVPEDTPVLFGPTGSVNGAVPVSARPGVNRASSSAPPAAEQRSQPEQKILPSVRENAVLPTIAPVVPLPKLETASTQSSKGKPTQPLESQPTVLTIALEKVLTGWPELLRGALERVAGDETVLQIPLAELEPGVKRGKVMFAWKQIRPWIVPSLAHPLAEYDAQSVELPLAEIAPIFMARRRSTGTRTASLTPVDIPDLFTSTPRPAGGEAAPSVEPHVSVATVSFSGPGGQRSATEVPAVAESVTLSSPGEPPSEPVRATGKPASALLDPGKTIDHMVRLPGISGALTCTEDGLVVAAKLPAGLVAETLAAFTPQLLRRAAQYTNEIGLGSPSYLEVALQDRLLLIVTISNGCLVVVSRPGESLPRTQINAFVAGLNRYTLKD
ncbi:MAG: roadblock/LC7 domain-containing protein [Verrucomicrobiales bacterium]|nr:roadblock/LC7 domain-containing protein [Verrucomicrobiales bacterium]